MLYNMIGLSNKLKGEKENNVNGFRTLKEGYYV